MGRYRVRVERVALALVLVLAWSGAARAALTKDQQKCVNALNKDFAKVAQTRGKAIQRCIKDIAKGKAGGTVEDCAGADPKGKIAKAEQKARDDGAKRCTGNDRNGAPRHPGVLATDADNDNAAAAAKELAMIGIIFGSDTGPILEADDKDGSKCQQAIAKDLQKCQDAKLREFVKCKKNALKEGKEPIPSGADEAAELEVCVLADPKGKIAKTCDDPGKPDKIRKDLDKKCVGKSQDLCALFPHCCPPCTGSDIECVHDCLEVPIECEACLAIDQADGLHAVCDLLDNGRLDQSCAPRDRDGDGHGDAVESCLGSAPDDPGRTPESAAIPGTCADGADNDRDGLTDENDPGCAPQGSVLGGFPPAGMDRFESSLSLNGYRLATPFGICPVDFEGMGPTCVERGDPVTDPNTGQETIDVEIVAMELTGTATIGVDPNCGLPAGPVPVTLYEHPRLPSPGKVTTLVPGTGDFAVDSFFDIFYDIETPLGTFPGGPPNGPAGAPVRVTNTDIHGLPPYHTPGNPCLNPNCYSVAGLTHQHCPIPPLDHYKVYNVVEEPLLPPLPVTLQDQFGGPDDVLLEAIDKFATPVRKTTEAGDVYEIADPFTHLVWYRFTGTAPVRSVDVHNQFGNASLTVTNPTHLLVAAVKNDECSGVRERFHFECYDAVGPPVDVPVQLDDQFDTELVTVGEPAKFCTPVDKNAEGIENDRDHLTCYIITPQASLGRAVTTLDQLGSRDLSVQENVYLCVPTRKLQVHGLECVDTWPTCNGPCPPGELCQNTGGSCICTPGPKPCLDTFPVCNGECDNPGDICVNVGLFCECQPLSLPCEMNEPPMCAGACPPGLVCREEPGVACVCMP